MASKQMGQSEPSGCMAASFSLAEADEDEEDEDEDEDEEEEDDEEEDEVESCRAETTACEAWNERCGAVASAATNIFESSAVSRACWYTRGLLAGTCSTRT
jgi:hypothetical protein